MSNADHWMAFNISLIKKESVNGWGGVDIEMFSIFIYNNNVFIRFYNTPTLNILKTTEMCNLL